MRKILLILAGALSLAATAQHQGDVLRSEPLRFPPPPVLYDTGGVRLPPDGKKLDADTGGGTIPGSASKKKDDMAAFRTGGQSIEPDMKGPDVTSDTGGTLPVSGKKQDYCDAGDTGGIRIPPDGKKHDLSADSGGAGSIGGIKDGSGGTKKLDHLADTGGSGATGTGMGKKLDLA